MNFEELTSNGIIIDHFPMHKRKLIEKIQVQFYKKFGLLKRGFLTGNWEKYMQGINMIKFYYGEDYAFEYAFLIHYQAWLQIPALFGFLITFYQLYEFLDKKDLKIALDTPFNSVFGVFVVFWSTIFIESWKRK